MKRLPNHIKNHLIEYLEISRIALSSKYIDNILREMDISPKHGENLRKWLEEFMNS